MVDTKMVFDHMVRSMFSEIYWSVIQNIYDEQMASGMIDIEEKEFDEGVTYLYAHLTEEQKSSLVHVADCYDIMWHHASKHGFFRGIALGLEAVTCPSQEYKQMLLALFGTDLNDLLTGEQCPYGIANREALRVLYELGDQLDDEGKDHLVSIELGYDQRVHSASLNSIYVGLLAAAEIIRQVNPEALTRIHAFILLFELHFTFRGKPWSFLN